MHDPYLSLFLFTIIFIAIVEAFTQPSFCVEVRGHLAEVSSVFLSCGYLGVQLRSLVFTY